MGQTVRIGIKCLADKKVQHLFFWGCSFFFLLNHFSISSQIKRVDYLYTFLFHISLVVGVYTNLRIAVPKLLDQGKYLFYLLALGLTVLGMILLHELTFDYGVDALLGKFYLISFYQKGELAKYYVIYLLLSLLLHLSRSWFYLQESEKKRVRAEKEQFQAELLALRAQVQPHFLFNSLNALYGLSLKKDPQLPEMIVKLSEVMRYMLHEVNEEEVPLLEEISYIENYLALQRLRHDLNLDLQFSATGTLDQWRIAPFLLIVFVENAFKHGGKGKDGVKRVGVEVEAFSGRLRVRIHNTVDVDQNKDHPSPSGLGLANARKRLELLYPHHRLAVNEQQDRFEVILILTKEK